MHLPDGIVSAAVAAGGYVAAGGLTWGTLRIVSKENEDPRRLIPRASLLTAVFFVASLVHFPLPPASVHLTLSGLMGVMLGWLSFPAIVVGLFFQAAMFQHGGLTTLGVNACLMGIPALLCHGLFQLRVVLGRYKKPVNAVLGFLAGFGAVAISAFFAALLLIYTIPEHLDAVSEKTAVIALSMAHVPVAVLEGVFTALLVLFLLGVKPELLETKK